MLRKLVMTTVLAIGATSAGLSNAAAAGVLVEAESFEDKGGWSVDQQFMQVMGSPYLLAHGLGRPVENARASVAIPAAGTYRVWVRTKNWVPGDWEAPGRFRVIINGDVLKTEFGTEAGWQWQDGGNVKLPAGTAKLQLQDLTGFDGRCDAIFLTTDTGSVPPNEGDALRKWRDALSGRPALPPSGGTYDVVIVGGGISGCGAALAAAEKGLKVALIHDRPILGGNASGEIRVHTIGIVGKAGSILNRINTKHWPNGSPAALKDDVKRHKTMESAEGVDLFLKWRAYDAPARNGKITAIYAQHIETGEARSFEAPVFIDSTGDGWIGFWAGADYSYGREARTEYNEGWEKNGDLWSPESADNRIMGSSLLWYAKPAKEPARFPEVPWAMDVAKKHTAVAGEWYWEYSRDELNAIDDAEAIRDHMLRAIYGSFYNASRQAKYASYRLDFVGYLSGKRESRRLMGDYLYTLKDITEGRMFPDAVAEETRDVDLHYQRQRKQSSFQQDFLSTALFMKVPRYFIPFRSLYSRNVENLMMAGRCFSCTHVALGGPRVMNTCGQMGVAVGYAAYLCKSHDTTPRGVYQDHVKELVELASFGRGFEAGSTEDEDAPPYVSITPPGKPLKRNANRYPVKQLPASLGKCTAAALSRGNMKKPGQAFKVKVNRPVVAHLAVQERGIYTPPAPWKATELRMDWGLGKDIFYKAEFPAGVIDVPPHTGKAPQGYLGVPHLLLLAPAGSGDPELKVVPVEE
jgi:hypothetical protein